MSRVQNIIMRGRRILLIYFINIYAGSNRPAVDLAHSRLDPIFPV